jgi:hypothetical protein
MGLELTWLAIVASLAMGLAGACLFVFAVKKDYFKNFEDAKYQVFWSDMEELVESSRNSTAESNDDRN